MELARRAIGYIRVSTHEQELSGLGLAAQTAAIEREIESREDLELERIVTEVESTRVVRDKLDAVLAEIIEQPKGERPPLIVQRLDRLGRDVWSLAGIIADAEKNGWELISLSPRFDMTDPFGKAMAHMASVFSQLERDLISMRTKEGLAQAKAQGRPIGRRVTMPADVEQWILEMRGRDWSYGAMADMLTAHGVPTAQGGKRWHPSTVHSTVRRLERAA